MTQVTNALMEHANSPDSSVSSAAFHAIGLLACTQISGSESSVLSARLAQSLREKFQHVETIGCGETATDDDRRLLLSFECMLLTCGPGEIGLLLQEAGSSR